MPERTYDKIALVVKNLLSRHSRDPNAHAPTVQWIAPTLENSWVNNGGGWEEAGYCKVNGIVYLRGLVALGTTSATIFTLPEGYRPGGDSHVVVATGGAAGIANVLTTGEVKHHTGASGTWFSLANISFPAEN